MNTAPETLPEMLRRFDLFANVSVGVLETFVEGCQPVTCRAGRPLIREGGEPVMLLLLSGCIRVFHRRGRSEVLVKLVRGPSTFGEAEALCGAMASASASTLEPSTVVQIPINRVSWLLRRSPDFAIALARHIGAQLLLAAETERVLAFQKIEERLATVLLQYADSCGTKESEGIKLPRGLSQVRLAKDLAASRKSLNRAVTKFTREGLLARVQARYVIVNPSAMRDRSNARSEKTGPKPGPADTAPTSKAQEEQAA